MKPNFAAEVVGGEGLKTSPCCRMENMLTSSVFLVCMETTFEVTSVPLLLGTGSGNENDKALGANSPGQM